MHSKKISPVRGQRSMIASKLRAIHSFAEVKVHGDEQLTLHEII